MAKILPKLIYLGVGIVGAMSLVSLISQPSLGISMANVPAYLLAIGGVTWGTTEFANFNLVEKLDFF
jgi:uncharacterized membrane protein YuzA (DUF378 family)